jgi:hypothetical protein
LLKIHIIIHLTLLLEVPTTLAGLLLEVPTALATPIVPDLAMRVVFSVEAVTASIQHLEEVPMALTALPMPIPTTAAT